MIEIDIYDKQYFIVFIAGPPTSVTEDDIKQLFGNYILIYIKMHVNYYDHVIYFGFYTF